MIVVKIGGGHGLNEDGIADDIAALREDSHTMVLVHGGAATLNDVATQLGHPPEFLTSPTGFTSRRTDRRTLEIFEMVYCGQMNKGWVERLQRRGLHAIGLAGIDGRIWEGPRKNSIRAVRNGRTVIVRDDYTGKVAEVNVPLLRSLIDASYVPVLCPPASSYEGEAINVDGDRAAAQTAVALQADTLLILSDVPGLLEHFPDESSLIRHIPTAQTERFIDVARGRMKKKILGAAEAVQCGVKRVILADGRVESPIQRALAGDGTVIGG